MHELTKQGLDKAQVHSLVIDRNYEDVRYVRSGGPYPLHSRVYYVLPRNFPSIDAYFVTIVKKVEVLMMIQVCKNNTLLVCNNNHSSF